VPKSDLTVRDAGTKTTHKSTQQYQAALKARARTASIPTASAVREPSEANRQLQA